MIHLDTHLVLWLYAGEHDRIPQQLRDRLESEPLAASPIVRLEMQLLREIGWLAAAPVEVLEELERSVGLRLDTTSFAEVAAAATDDRLAFTRDPFDRLIAAQALAAGATLATKDRALREHLPFAVWD